MARPTTPPGFQKPSMETRFHIDYDWWQQSGKDIDLHIQQLCDEIGDIEFHAAEAGGDNVDWVDPFSAHVVSVDQAQYAFLMACSNSPDFITDRTTLVEAIFRTLLASGNRPMTPVEIAMRIDRPAETILRTLSGVTVYKGLRPYLGD
nr:hypothetical protein [Anaerolineae bacterium]